MAFQLAAQEFDRDDAAAAIGGSPWTHSRWRRIIDAVLAVTLLGMAALPLLILGALVRVTSPGPAVFVQRRLGQGGRVFDILKLRTLRCDEPGRLTPIGGFLRRTSLDELPQLWNVVRGDMALVGPRPYVPEMLIQDIPYEQLTLGFDRRLAVRPGLTGLAQARGLRGPLDDAQAARLRLDADLAYIAQATPMLDAQILWRTLRHQFLTGSGA